MSNKGIGDSRKQDKRASFTGSKYAPPNMKRQSTNGDSSNYTNGKFLKTRFT